MATEVAIFNNDTNNKVAPVDRLIQDTNINGSNFDDKQNETSSSSGSEDNPIKCSAVHTMERDMPDFDYSHLIRELKDRILQECNTNPGFYATEDIDKCRHDDWFVTRFLLRNKLDVDESFEMMKKAMRFNNESLCNLLRAEDFPAEFYQLGALFPYLPDRKGNLMLYMRVKVHRKLPEIQTILQAFIYHNIRSIDQRAKGKGICVVIDCSGAGLANADMDTLLYLIQTLRNYFPKGLSYFLVHELPWILKPFWLIAKAWISEEHSQLVKFSYANTIYEYIDKENLPDFMGGTCEQSYKTPPENCTSLAQAGKLWGIEPAFVKKIISRFSEYLPERALERYEEKVEEMIAKQNNNPDELEVAIENRLKAQ